MSVAPTERLRLPTCDARGRARRGQLLHTSLCHPGALHPVSFPPTSSTAAISASLFTTKVLRPLTYTPPSRASCSSSRAVGFCTLGAEGQWSGTACNHTAKRPARGWRVSVPDRLAGQAGTGRDRHAGLAPTQHPPPAACTHLGQQVPHLLLVDLQHAGPHQERLVGAGTDGGKDVAEGAGDDARPRWQVGRAAAATGGHALHRVSLQMGGRSR